MSDYQEGEEAEVTDMVNHPPHYTSHPAGIEALDVLRHGNSYSLTTAMKYIWRVNFGSKYNDREDIEKAVFYLNDWLNNTAESASEAAERTKAGTK